MNSDQDQPNEATTIGGPEPNLSSADQSDVSKAIDELAAAAGALAHSEPSVGIDSNPEPANSPVAGGESNIPPTDPIDNDLPTFATSIEATEEVSTEAQPTEAQPTEAQPTESTNPTEDNNIEAAPAISNPTNDSDNETTPIAPSSTGEPTADIAAAATELDADAVITSIDEPETTPENSIPPKIGVHDVESGAKDPEGIGINSTSVLDSIDSAPTSINIETPSEEDSIANRPKSDSSTGIGDTINNNVVANEENNDASILSSDADDDEPLKPADPVPGSIGSAVSYSATALHHSVATGKAKKAKKTPIAAAVPTSAESDQSEDAGQTFDFNAKNTASEGAPTSAPANKVKKNSKILAVIIIAITLLVGALICIFVFIVLSPSNNPSVTPTNNSNDDAAYNASPDPELVDPTAEQTQTDADASLICTYTSTSEDVNEAKDSSLASYDSKMIANYKNGQLLNISTNNTYNYTSADAAAEGARQARLAYQQRYAELGLREDPFTSNYPVTDKHFIVSHFAESDKINKDSAALFFLTADANEEVATDADTVRAAYTGQRYTCDEDTNK